MAWWAQPKTEIKDFRGYVEGRADMIKGRTCATWREALKPKRGATVGVDVKAIAQAQAVCRKLFEDRFGPSMMTGVSLQAMGFDVRMIVAFHTIPKTLIKAQLFSTIVQPMGVPVVSLDGDMKASVAVKRSSVDARVDVETPEEDEP